MCSGGGGGGSAPPPIAPPAAVATTLLLGDQKAGANLRRLNTGRESLRVGAGQEKTAGRSPASVERAARGSQRGRIRNVSGSGIKGHIAEAVGDPDLVDRSGGFLK